MSNSPETDLDLDLHFLPAWAQKAADPNRYANYAGESAPSGDRKGGQWDRRPRSRQPSGPQRRDPSGPPRRDQERGRGGPRRPEGGRRPDGGRRREDGPRREAPAPPPLPDLNVSFRPDDRGVDSLARQIKMTGRAYPLFDIAQMILQKPERHSLTLSVQKKADGQVGQPLFVCALDETLWLSEEEAIHWVLDKHFTTFYQPERTAIDPPKGTYTFVAQCGMSGVILGPPNYHDYQNQLRKLHADRFSRMPFEAFKARVRIVKDEAVVKKWIEEQSWKTEYTCLNLPEPLRLGSRAEVETHFRTTHLPNIIRQVESFSLGGIAARNLRSSGLTRLIRSAWEDQRRFPLQIATVLSQQFAAHDLQFFKVNRTVTHVAVARPHYLDLDAAPVSEGVKRIVQIINATPKCTRRRVMEIVAPAPPAPVVAPAPAAATEGSPAPAPVIATPEPSPEATAAGADLHWLIHQGHVIEFANGVLETAKKPLPKPPKPAPKAPATASPEGEKAAAGPAEPAVAVPAAEPAVELGTVTGAAPATTEAPADSGITADAPATSAPAETGAPVALAPAPEAPLPAQPTPSEAAPATTP